MGHLLFTVLSLQIFHSGEAHLECMYYHIVFIEFDYFERQLTVFSKPYKLKFGSFQQNCF